MVFQCHYENKKNNYSHLISKAMQYAYLVSLLELETCWFIVITQNWSILYSSLFSKVTLWLIFLLITGQWWEVPIHKFSNWIAGILSVIKSTTAAVENVNLSQKYLTLHRSLTHKSHMVTKHTDNVYWSTHYGTHSCRNLGTQHKLSCRHTLQTFVCALKGDNSAIPLA